MYRYKREKKLLNPVRAGVLPLKLLEKPFNVKSTQPNKEGKIVILDEFNKDPNIDINGDNYPDYTHGDLIYDFMKSFDSDLPLEKMEISDNPAECFDELYNRITQNGEKIRVVNFSSSSSRELKTELYRVKNFLNHNLSPKKIRKLIRDDVLKTRFPLLYNLSGSIQKLVNLGVDVRIAAGNDGQDYINLRAIEEGVTVVRATNALGELNPNDNNTDYFAKVKKARGIYSVREIDGKYDLNDDGIGDVAVDRFPQKPSVIKKVTGQYVSDCVKPLEFFGGIDEICYMANGLGNHRLVENYLVTVEDYAEYRELTDQETQALKYLGDYTFLNSFYESHYNNLFFRKDEEGKLYFDPDNTGRKDAVGLIYGTSFAAPTSIVEDYSKKSETLCLTV